MTSDGFQNDEELAFGQTLSIEFTLLSGETVTVRDTLEEPVTEATIRSYADELIHQMGSDTVRTFAYLWDGEFYVDAVRLREVAALSVSTVPPDEDEDGDDWEE
ncbi:MAG TPA: hypothetical protein VFC51_06690 [Chloroflexota bacterium]|nr:hypothetical protein [Chloroflexota bacterium]